jgi:hypothetical protein
VTVLILAACLGFGAGYLIAWIVDPEGLLMAVARVLVGTERLEEDLRAFHAEYLLEPRA